MKTPEEIKLAMECCKAGDCMSCPYLSNDNTLPCNVVLSRDVFKYITQLEDHIRDLTNMVPRRISVKDRLPPKNDVCVLYHCDTTGAVTHWMPLPEPPKEEHHD